ncbi:MAG: hypothetical protein JXR30_03835, partial [Alphaproteobacteria bacterium]|nr:hypothetical protein [Alphaproteobacteria bacterium]
KVYHEGAILISLQKDKKGNLIGKPIISSLGVFESDTTGMIKKSILNEVIQVFKGFSKEDRTSQSRQEQKINTAVRKGLKDFTSQFKRPKIVIHFMEG